jgi:hypothetical protein
MTFIGSAEIGGDVDSSLRVLTTILRLPMSSLDMGADVHNNDH